MKAIIGVRLPSILGQAIDDVSRKLNKQVGEHLTSTFSSALGTWTLPLLIRVRATTCGSSLARIHNGAPMTDDGEGDFPFWNRGMQNSFKVMIS
ncbi:hypothetical protein FS749_001223 [Ceratobasidium sp. UAMH 11750]|nr:hypothetical protein FS749_001223 [Ceratobasidium sp. UAMH 11750]